MSTHVPGFQSFFSCFFYIILYWQNKPERGYPIWSVYYVIDDWGGGYLKMHQG